MRKRCRFDGCGRDQSPGLEICGVHSGHLADGSMVIFSGGALLPNCERRPVPDEGDGAPRYGARRKKQARAKKR